MCDLFSVSKSNENTRTLSPGASPEQPRSVPGTSREHPRSSRAPKQQLLVDRTSNRPGSAPDRAGFRPGPGSAPDMEPTHWIQCTGSDPLNTVKSIQSIGYSVCDAVYRIEPVHWGQRTVQCAGIAPLCAFERATGRAPLRTVSQVRGTTPWATQGTHGPHGAQGTHGPHGTQGTHGPHGAQGSHRLHGAQGPHGPREPMGPGTPWAPWDPGNPWAPWGPGTPWAGALSGQCPERGAVLWLCSGCSSGSQKSELWLTSSSIMVPLWLHSGSILATFWLEGAPRGVPVPTDWTKRNQALRCWVRVRVGDGVVISWRVGHWRALGAPRECPWDVLAVFGHPLEPGKRVPIIMSRIMFDYVRNYVREFCANLNQAGWFK